MYHFFIITTQTIPNVQPCLQTAFHYRLQILIVAYVIFFYHYLVFTTQTIPNNVQPCLQTAVHYQHEQIHLSILLQQMCIERSNSTLKALHQINHQIYPCPHHSIFCLCEFLPQNLY